MLLIEETHCAGGGRTKQQRGSTHGTGKKWSLKAETPLYRLRFALFRFWLAHLTRSKQQLPFSRLLESMG